ncbi:hypothetical protein M2454_002686 [Aequitasia blattaphilus]|uniref:DUF4446 family protein n=1 Tax=Aequitasia blattaphilus TaxID=2949332 RepID=A0ABT1EF81_9FIRM|nr:DUF4446 family protein [Aequitasia blattaphilus]MCP1103117.1 DUF4446 family protein [Aequitasia blattaphilus]MCR8615757.1 DUF4446 family protein [Aequitasia blattaphilus]
MESKILKGIGIDPGIFIIILFIAVIILAALLFKINMNYVRLKNSYGTFMKGRDAKSLEEAFRERFSEMDSIVKVVKQNRIDLRILMKKNANNYQKLGIIKYDAFNEMGGKLSFALAMLDEKNNGWIINAMHSREGCYTYIKEIVKGRSYVELAEEEAEALDKAIYNENFELNEKEKEEE